MYYVSILWVSGDRGSTLVKVLCYNSEGHLFDPSWHQWIFHWHKILPIALWHWGRSASNRNDYQEYFLGGKSGRCVRLTTYHHPVSSRNLGALNFLEPSGPLQACNNAANRMVASSIPAGVSGFFIDIKSFRSHYGPGVDSASNTNEYQEYFLVVKAAGA